MILDGVKVEFGLVEDETIASDSVTVTGTDESEFSNAASTTDRGEKQKIAYLEDDYWLLDGSFIMPFAGTNLISDSSFEGTNWTTTSGTMIQENTVRTGTKSLYFGESGRAQNLNVSVVAGHRYFIGFYSKSVSYRVGTEGQIIGEKPADPNIYNRYDSESVSRNLFFSGEEWKSVKSTDGWWFSCAHGIAGSDGKGITIESHSYISGSSSRGYVDDIVMFDLTEAIGNFGTEYYDEIVDILLKMYADEKTIHPKIGYESSIFVGPLSDVTLTYEFGKMHDSYGIMLKFPSTCVQRDFSIAYYAGDTLIDTVRYVDNNAQELYTNEDTRLQWNKVVITITESQTGQRARLEYVIFGVNDQYREDELISVSANRTISPTAEYAESGELSFSFFNDGRYAIHTIKELSQNVIDRLRMQVYVRRQFETEYTKFGVYYAESGKVEEQGKVITFTGHDGLYKLDDVMFTAGKVYPEGRSLADWGREVAQAAGVQIEISEAFESIMSSGYIAEVPCREAFRLIAEAGHGIFCVDENDVMHLWAYDDIVKNAEAIADENIVDKRFSLDNSNKYMGVKITQYTFTKRTDEEELGKVENIAIGTELQTIEIDFSTVPVDIDTVRIEATSGDANIVEKTNGRVKLTISGEEDEEVTISVYGIAYDTVITTIERGETKKDVKEISENFLITVGIGEPVADYQNEHAVNKYNYDLETVITEDLRLGEVREMQGQTVVITDVGFSISYEDQEETIKGVDK